MHRLKVPCWYITDSVLGPWDVGVSRVVDARRSEMAICRKNGARVRETSGIEPEGGPYVATDDSYSNSEELKSPDVRAGLLPCVPIKLTP